MKINIDDIPESGFSLDLKEDGAVFDGLAGGKLYFSFSSPVAAHLEISKKGRSIFVSGEIKTGIHLNCSRCLKDFDYPFDADFASYYERGAEPEKEKELKAADMDVNYISGDTLDTSELLLGQISLELPMQPLCSTECKGLCPRCGADLNLGDCGCGRDEKTDSKFAKLKDFKVK
ncbi:MAG TPA: hypothetical protein DDW94_11280 [Deltaproteobacteria bacterium]|nr:MAG: hypothetical protein A2Z79_04840 [Deltaproteobacteria bacterium GWA2_55_82]OGQ63888.1 MAG: hypothetical protein A3I81_12815 [Deltaproteobacteria bacterium RIFCSPLOWO2_02_FULL_55_12]OIJ72650.1 MAG: hypothetical protein A2V21_312410 [Deltaproteobacteria bacterium GWC2_55_46]HBG47552.1 hypothetical protein [Deltaproteobacteria bacterium]HCY10463.1 hypothetical protein [Deltaproteobacteria bacterium]